MNVMEIVCRLDDDDDRFARDFSTFEWTDGCCLSSKDGRGRCFVLCACWSLREPESLSLVVDGKRGRSSDQCLSGRIKNSFM